MQQKESDIVLLVLHIILLVLYILITAYAFNKILVKILFLQMAYQE